MSAWGSAWGAAWANAWGILFSPQTYKTVVSTIAESPLYETDAVDFEVQTIAETATIETTAVFP